MASKIKKGESIYIPFIDGESVLNSQNSPRMYKTVERFKKVILGFILKILIYRNMRLLYGAEIANTMRLIVA